MSRAIWAALVVAVVITSGLDAQQSKQNVEKTIELTRRDSKLTFVEPGKDYAEPITIVVGEKVRFVNRDTESHTVVSTVVVEGKPLFSTGVIKPGEYVDLLFDIDLYERAGGKPANVVTLKYRSDQQLGEDSEIRLLSAAKR
jgi:plastocyanin